MEIGATFSLLKTKDKVRYQSPKCKKANAPLARHLPLACPILARLGSPFSPANSPQTLSAPWDRPRSSRAPHAALPATQIPYFPSIGAVPPRSQLYSHLPARPTPSPHLPGARLLQCSRAHAAHAAHRTARARPLCSPLVLATQCVLCVSSLVCHTLHQAAASPTFTQRGRRSSSTCASTAAGTASSARYPIAAVQARTCRTGRRTSRASDCEEIPSHTRP